MVYFPESSVIIGMDGVQFKTFSNEHPPGFIIVKPKYIPLEEVFCENLQCRSLFNKDFNRLDMWSDKESLNYYVEAFLKSYPHYKFNSEMHKTWFFAIPNRKIKQVFDSFNGIKALMSTPKNERDEHISITTEFIEFILKSKVPLNDLGISFSTLVGHYDSKYSDINLVICGKGNSWKVLNFLTKVIHPSLRWKTAEEWESFRQKRNRSRIFTKEEFSAQMSRKHTEGFFKEKLFVLLPIEKEEEVWSKWGDESYSVLGVSEVEGTVVDNYDSLVRPGRYKIKNSKTIKGKSFPVSQIVFYSRDYVEQAFPEEKIRACGLLEKVNDIKTGKTYYRIVIGYFDSYLNERREQEYIKKVN